MTYEIRGDYHYRTLPNGDREIVRYIPSNHPKRLGRFRPTGEIVKRTDG